MIIGGKLLLALVLGSTSSVSATADIVDSNTIDNNNNAAAAVGETNHAADTKTLRKKKKKNRKLNSGGKSGKGHSGSWSSSSGDMYWYKDGKPYSSGG